MDRITRHPLMQDMPFETVIDYIVDFIRIVGTPPSFVEKVETIDIVDYRGLLPCDYYQVIQVRMAGPHCHNKEVFRNSTDSFHMSPRKSKWNELTYKIQGDCIFTSLEQGKIEMAYMAMPVDDEGYPLIPDNSAYTRALELYVKLQWFTILFDMGKISPQVYQNAQQQYSWAVGQAQTNLIIPSIDQMQSITAMWNKFLPDTTRDFYHGFINEGTEEHIITH